MKAIQILTIAVCLGAFGWAPVLFGAPLLIDYQGFLSDESGLPITDTLSIGFAISSSNNRSTVLWGEIQYGIVVRNGLFAVTLGSVNAIEDSVFNGDERWLGITVNGTELSPLTRIVSMPYSLRVNTIDGATGGTITGDINIPTGSMFASNAYVGLNNSVTSASNFVAGDSNVLSSEWGTIGGGTNNMGVDSGWITIGGGRNNFASGKFGSVSGGFSNRATNFYTVVGGGLSNHSSGYYATVSGGQQNTASFSAATVCGGYSNRATGASATVAGGSQNEANGLISFAAGTLAKANHAGSFVWADTNSTPFSSSLDNQFNIRASGGTRIFSNSTLTAGVTLAPGGSAWNAVSDSTLKRNKRLVDGGELLANLMQLPIKQWSYKSQDPSIEHIGPMAQDFYTIFGVGENDKTISTIDPAGIALAAIQEVYRAMQELQAKTERIDVLETQLAELRTQLTAVASHLERQHLNGPALSVVTSQQ